jgi:phosphate transport system substrate-binding protein
MVNWLVGPGETHQPQTEAEKQAGIRAGRKAPAPELLQPTLDPALGAYRPRKDLKLSGSFRGASSDVLVALVNLWIKRFEAYYPGVQIRIAPPYAGSLGAKELIKESVDFVAMSRELKPDDITEFSARFGYAPTSIPFCGGSYRHFGFLDAIGFIVHPDNPLQKLDYAQVDALFSSTRLRGGAPIRTWGELGLTGEWADKPIHVYAIKPWNGFEEFVRQRVLSTGGKRGEWRSDLGFEDLVFPMAGKVAGDRYAIGYTGLAYLDVPVKVLPLAMDVHGPFWAPTYENVASAQYPLSRLMYLAVNKAPSKPLPPALEEFLRFILSREGQQAVLDLAVFLPLRASQAADSSALLAK